MELMKSRKRIETRRNLQLIQGVSQIFSDSGFSKIQNDMADQIADY